MIHNQPVISIHAHLHALPHMRLLPPTKRHRAAIRIRERDLFLPTLSHPLLQTLVLLLPFLQPLDLLFRFFRSKLAPLRLPGIVLVLFPQVLIDLFLDLF